MNLYFIDFMTKFTFIFLSLPPSHTPFHWPRFPSGEEGKTTYFKKKIKIIKVTRNKRAPTRGSQGGFRPPLWLLSSAFSYLYDTGQEKRFPTPLRWDAGQSVFFFLFFCPLKSFLKLKSPTALCPFTSLPSQNKLNTLNPRFFLRSLLSSRWLRETAPREINKEKSYTRCRLTFYFILFFFSLSFFLCQGNEMKNISAMVHQPQTHTQWPATYPKQLQVSLEVTTIFFYAVHIRYIL